MDFQTSAGSRERAAAPGRVRQVAGGLAMALALCSLSPTGWAATDEAKAALHGVRSITGSMDVKLNALESQVSAQPPLAALGRKGLVKRYHGELDAQAEGEMLTVGGTVKGSAAYVAVERVVGTLAGRAGSFALVHRGVMRRGQEEPLLVTVVPDSGTGELAGLSGVLRIERRDGQHVYHFDFTLP